MKKTMKRIFASMLAFAMMLCAVPTMSVAAEEKAYDVFIAFGGDVESGDWGYQYYGDGAASNAGDITATNATIKEGETAKVSLEFASPVAYTWFTAPVVAGNFSEADFSVKVLIDGKDVTDTVNFAADDKNWWAEATGDYAEDQCVRLAGGYNEWATKYIAESPAGFTKLEFEITANKLVEGSAAAAGAPVESTEEYKVFLAYGGDKESGDWGYQYYGEGAASNAGDIKATDATIKVGETATIALEFATPVAYTWFMAPVITASGVVEADFDVQVLVDGKDITDTVNFAADDKAFWAEATGDYTEEQCIRLAGGYNEWATKYIAESPAGVSKIEYVITANSIKVGGAAGGPVPSTDTYDLFVAFGGDKESGDWGYQYYGEGAGSNAGEVTATDAKIKVGETARIGLEFPTPVAYTWFTAPTLGNANNVVEADFTVKVFIDGKDVTDTVNFAADDKAWWNEATGDHPEESCIRLAGGYNEWATKYIAESPAGFTKLEFEVTANSIMVGGATEEEASAQASYDENGVYHAYFGVQTPTWIFRNAHDDATYGKDSGCFDQLGFVDGDWVAQGGSFTDVEIAGNGRYTVGVTGYDFSGTFQDQAILGADGLFNLLFVSTDLPMNDNIVLSNVTLKMDGKEIVTQAEAFLDADSKEVKKILLANIWNNEIEALPYYAAPTQSIEISFDVSGFAYDKAAEEAPVEQAPAETTAPAESQASTETKVETAETTVDTSADVEPASNNTMVIVIVVVVVAVVAVVAGVMVSKKKNTKAE
ncbi:MAG: hypothetical protein E7290_03505 [Lachnospiraceae bacterium]|nr:hypothetical protein [Lachnospiraceae bacterium]